MLPTLLICLSTLPARFSAARFGCPLSAVRLACPLFGCALWLSTSLCTPAVRLLPASVAASFCCPLAARLAVRFVAAGFCCPLWLLACLLRLHASVARFSCPHACFGCPPWLPALAASFGGPQHLHCARNTQPVSKGSGGQRGNAGWAHLFARVSPSCRCVRSLAVVDLQLPDALVYLSHAQAPCRSAEELIRHPATQRVEAPRSLAGGTQ